MFERAFMKSCPQCQKQYSDESLNFCLECGKGLVYYGQIAPTVLMNDARQTANTPNQNPQRQFQNAPPVKRNKSNAWIWLIGIFTFLFLLGGLAFVGLIFIAANLPETDNTNQQNNSKQKNSVSSDNPNSSSSRTNVLKDDLMKWKYEDPTVGKSIPILNELEMNSIDNSHYFMLSTPNSSFQTANATTKLTIKNPNNQSTTLGYGLLIHCDENKPGKKDYAFLIDSKGGGFRIAKHVDTKEIELVPWTKSKNVNLGSETNEIEVKDMQDSMEFYINGSLVKSIKHSDGNTSGIVGLYTGTGFPISFSNLEIRK